MPEKTPIELHDAYAEWSLLDYLCLLWPERSRRAIHELFAGGAVRAAGRPVSPRRLVGELTELELHGSLAELPSVVTTEDETELEREVEILHEDARVAVAAKPAGLPVVPDRTRRTGSLLAFWTRRELAAREQKRPEEFVRYRVVHRIDRWTSGVVILARTPAVERELAAAFEERRVRKEYVALVRGDVHAARIAVNCPVGPGRKGRMRAAPGARSKRAFTTFDVLERLPGFTLLRARPRTGRQHQIRVHAWAAGHPLAVDPVYAVGPTGRGPPPPVIERLTLHAARYELPDSWDEPRSFSASLPADFEGALTSLRSLAESSTEDRSREK